MTYVRYIINLHNKVTSKLQHECFLNITEQFLSLFLMPLIDRTAEDMTENGEREWGNDTQQRATGGIRTHGCCRGLTDSVHGAAALPTELPRHP